MTVELYNRIWQLSPNVHQAEAYDELTAITKELIGIYTVSERMEVHPFASAFHRTLNVPLDALNKKLQNSTCLVTGGFGCVGSTLVKELAKLDVAQIVILDIAPAPKDYLNDNRITCINCDIRDAEAVMHYFSVVQPHYVFHTAAQRNPGYAEWHVYETFQTNVIGSLHIANACEQTGSVKQCVFSSTGKSSRYYTNEVYAQTKKMCEYIFDTYARNGRVLYAMARFTHIIDNSLMNEELELASRQNDYIAIHSPGKYVTAQNATEAAALLLNGIVYATEGHCNFLIVRHLEWPVESLELALYYIKTSGRNIPVIFKGNPLGYTEKFFRGQLDWSHPEDLNLLINVYECSRKWLNEAGDIILSHICPVKKSTLLRTVEQLKDITDEQLLKDSLTEQFTLLVHESLEKVDKQHTLNILRWGLQEDTFQPAKATAKDFGLIISLLIASLQGSAFYEQIQQLVFT